MNIEQIIKHLDAARAALVSMSGQTFSDDPPVASYEDITGEYGDPMMQYLPKSIEHLNGKNLSHLSKDDLLLIAKRLEYRAKMDDKEGRLDKHGNPKSKYDKRNARLARGWAAHGPAAQEQPAVDRAPEGDIPF